MDEAMQEFATLSAQLAQSETGFLTELGPLILVAAARGIAHDTRRFARLFDVANALVIRECVHLKDELELLDFTDRNERTGNVTYKLSAHGDAVVAAQIDRSENREHGEARA